MNWTRNSFFVVALAIVASIPLSGCDIEPARNHPSEQAEDYKVCRDAGMQGYLNGYQEVKCSPPEVSRP